MVLLNGWSVEECQRARMSRDPRFDGCFFIAVKTTGIFCRSICPANLPKEENVEYFSTQAQAVLAGYRPCLRCRPESAPNSWAWKGAKTTFLRALTLIEQGELDSSLAGLASRLGISDRYLRQLFQRHLGLPPKQYAQIQQLMFAKQLLHSSQMAITDIAYASGFHSTRRFNDAFHKLFRLTPSQVRRDRMDLPSRNQLSLTFRGPFDWAHMLDFYRLRAIDGMEQVDAGSYQRHFVLGEGKGWFKATMEPPHLRIEFEMERVIDLRHLVARLRRMFDLDADLVTIEAQLAQVAPGLIIRSGIRIPGVWNSWEAGVRAVLGQQVSVKAAIGQLNLLTAQLTAAQNGPRYFPTPEQVSTHDLSFLRMPQKRKETLKRLADYVQRYPQASPAEWLQLSGIGPWTVDYAQLRGESQSDRLLTGDLVVKKALARFPLLTTQSVAPWGSYATFHCWSH